jgi:hypothetical protein
MEVRIDLSEWEHLIKQLSPNRQIRFINGFINRALFFARESMVNEEMKKIFKIRTNGLLRKHLTYKKAVGLVGYFGSTKSERFTAWREQQLGVKQERKININTVNARGNSGMGILKKRFRRNNQSIQRLDRMSDKYGERQKKALERITYKPDDIVFKIAKSILKQYHYTGPVYLPKKWGNRVAGVYNMISSGGMKLMSANKSVEPEHVQWATIGINRFLVEFKSKSNRIAEEEFLKAVK